MDVTVRAYRLPLHLHDIPEPLYLLDTTEVRARLSYGELTYFDHGSPYIELTLDRVPRFRTGKNAGIRTTPTGAYLVVLVPISPNPPAGMANTSDDYLWAVEGLLVAVAGPAIAYRQVFENTLHLQTGSVSAIIHHVENPGWCDPPHFTRDVPLMQQVHASLLASPAEKRNRISLALRWLAQAVHERDADALIKFWIAIETVAMPDDTNVAPAERALAAAYGITLEAVKDRFGLGRLQGLRSEIVHRGCVLAIPGEVAKMLQGLFLDLLLHELALPASRKAAEYEIQGKFVFRDWLRAQAH